MSTKTPALTIPAPATPAPAITDTLSGVARDRTSFDPVPSWRRAGDVAIGAARSAPAAAGAVGVPVGTKGPVPKAVGLDRATLGAAGFDGKVGQTLVVPRHDGATVVVIGTGTRRPVAAEVRDAAAAFARAAGKYGSLATTLADTAGVATPPRPLRRSSKACCSRATASAR